MHPSVHLAIIPFFGLLASSFVLQPRSAQPDGPLLPSSKSVYGRDQEEDKQPCGPNRTVLTCAESVAKTWQIPKSAKGEPERMRIPMQMGVSKGYIEPLVYIEASECKLSNARRYSTGDTIYCGISSCQQWVTVSTTDTRTDTYGFTTSITLEASAEFEVPLVAKFNTKLSTTNAVNWQKAQSWAITNTTSKVWTLSNGQQCTPTTIQYGVECHTQIRLAGEETSWPFKISEVSALRLGQPITYAKHLGCNDDDINFMRTYPNSDNSQFVKFCSGLTSPGQTATIDIGLSGSQGAWSMEGCMWNTAKGDA